jgi:hypothetical protein
VEELESRIVPTLPLPAPVAPTPLPLPSPLVPDHGDQQILDHVLDMATTNRHVLNNLPVPYVIVASAGGAAPTVTDGHAHSPVDIDADQSEATGQGGSGKDIRVEVDAFVDPVPHLVLTVDRLGTAPFATNLSVVIAFPFAGFDLEPGLPSTPNLVMGFQTRATGDTPGGYAPLHEVITLTPGTLAGTSHTFTATMSTTGADNPLSFILGNLDGTNVTGTLNAAGFRAYVENVPATISTTVTTSETSLASPVNSQFNLNWLASSASLVKFDYLESVGPPSATPDFNTSLVANQMPTSEQFALGVNEPGGQMTLSQHANAGIASMTFQKTRSDGLAVVGNASGVPTAVDLTMNLAGSATLTDNANIGSLAAQASKTGGFAGSSSFLGYNVGTVGIAVTNAPSLSAAYSRSGTDRVFTAAPATAGNVIGSLEFLASSDSPANVQLPGLTCGAGSWSNPAWDILSMVDTGTGDTSVPAVYAPGATAAARLLNFKSVQYTQHANWPTIGNFLDLVTTTATPLKIYLRTTPTSLLIPGHDIEITEEVQNVPAGEFMFTFNGPTNFHYSTNPLTGIGSVHVCGHIDTLAFDIDAADLPAIFALDWDPDSHLNITSQSSPGVEAFLGHITGLLSDSNGITLPGISDVGVLFGGTRLQTARMRVDHVPSITATWVATDGTGHTSVQFNTAAPGLFAGGIQFASSTNLTDPALASAPTPAPSLTADYATFNDTGPLAVPRLQDMLVGIVGIHSFSYVVTNATDVAHIIWDDNRPVPFNLNLHSATGGIYFAGNKVTLIDNVGLVPSHLDYMTNLDYRQVLTGTDFLPFLDVTFDKNEGLPAGCTLHVHADTLPPVTVFDYEPAAGTFSILAQDLAFHDTQKFGDVILDLECPDGLPGTDSVLGARVEQAIMRLDNVPSFTGTYATTAAGTTIGLMSVAPGLSIGAVQVEISTAQDLPPLGPPTGSGDVDTVTLSDPGGASAKHLVAQLFGLTNFNYSTFNATRSQTIVMTQDAARKMIATVVSNGGKFFNPHNVDLAITIDQLPTSITLTTDGMNSLSYNGNSDIGSITVGGHGGAAEGFFDMTKVSLSATGLPANLGFTIDPTSQVTLTASPHSVSKITVHLHNPNGLGGGTVLLGDALRDARLQLDNVPSLTASWSGASGTSVNFDATSSGTFLGGAQVGLSSQEGDTTPGFVTGSGTATAADYVKVDDEGSGNVKRVAVGLFGIGHFSLSTQDGSHGLTVGYAANADHELKVNIDSNFGHFFSTYNIHAFLDVQTVPRTWNFSSDFATTLNYTASSGISQVTATAEIDKTSSSADNTHAEFTITGLPSSVTFTMVPNASASLTMSGALTEIKLLVKSDNGILGMSNYHLVAADLNNIPASWSANWSGSQFVLQASAPMGEVTGLVSTSDDGPTNVNKILPFTQSGPGGARVNYSPYASTIDNRYYNAAPGGAPATLAEIDVLYNHAHVLGAGEDHAVVRISGGSLDIADFQFTGFQAVQYQPNNNGGHFEFDAPSPGTHEFLAGADLNGKFLVAHIDNIPDQAVLNIDLAGRDIHFFTHSASMATAGDIDVYYGPARMAQDSDRAVRMVMQHTPDDVHIFWNFGFPSGSANFVASNAFTLLFLYQDGGTRVTAGARLKELQAGYNVDFHPHFSVGTTFGIPTSLDLIVFHAIAGIDNDVNFDGGGNPIIAPNYSKPPVDGFFSLYNMKSNPGGLTDQNGNPLSGAPSPGPSEYVPQLSFLMKGFRELSFDFTLGVHVFGFSGFLTPFANFTPTVIGQFALDFWAPRVDLSISLPILGDFGLFNAPDWTDNTPIHLIPVTGLYFRHLHDVLYTFDGFSTFASHFDPFSPMLAAGQGPGGDVAPLDPSSIGPIFVEALDRWRAAGIDPAQLAALGGTDIEIADLGGSVLGLAYPDTDTIVLSRDAAGYGWFTDPNPGDAPAAGRMDLLTVITHEVGHLLGFDHDGDSGDAMEAALRPGERLAPPLQPGAADRTATSAVAGPDFGTAVAVPRFAGVPTVPAGSVSDFLLAALAGMLDRWPSVLLDEDAARGTHPAPAALNDPRRAAVLDAVHAGQGNALSDHMAPAHVFSLMEQLPPDDGAIVTSAGLVDLTAPPWTNQ